MFSETKAAAAGLAAARDAIAAEADRQSRRYRRILAAFVAAPQR